MDPRISRRTVLLGGVGAAVLAACGDGKSASPDTTAGPGYALLQLFDPNALLVADGPQRAPFGLADAQGVPLDTAPASLDFTVTLSGQSTGTAISVARRDKDLPRAYFPVVFTPEGPGTYTASTTIDGQTISGAFSVQAADAIPVPRRGQPMVPFDTPTTDDHRGVDPICTREPACPLHDLTLSAALAEGTPVAFLVSTPKYCQVAICGPVLDLLLAAGSGFPNIRMLHAEVWKDGTLTAQAPAVTAYSLTYEPVLFLAGADGVIRERLDNIYDGSELAEALGRLVAGA